MVKNSIHWRGEYVHREASGWGLTESLQLERMKEVMCLVVRSPGVSKMVAASMVWYLASGMDADFSARFRTHRMTTSDHFAGFPISLITPVVVSSGLQKIALGTITRGRCSTFLTARVPSTGRSLMRLMVRCRVAFTAYPSS